MNRDLTTAEQEQKILNTFKYYTQGPSVPSDGNCGLHAICKALGDALRLTGSSVNPNSLMLNIFDMFELKNLPNYWWSDEELAFIANSFGFDMYIYNEKDGTGIVYGKSIRPPLVLYSVNNNSHWIPGIKTVVPSLYIPEHFNITQNISEELNIKKIQNNIKRHLLMRSLNPSGGRVDTNSVRYDRSRSSSNVRRVIGINKKSNRSGSVGRDGWRDVSHSGRHNVRHNKIRDESCSRGRNGRRSSRGRDEVRISKQNGSGPKLEKSHDDGVKHSHRAGEKESHSGGEIGSYSKREKSNSRKSDEKLLVQYSPLVNDDHNFGKNEIKQKLSLFEKLKNTVLSKIIRQLYHWTRNKKNKYEKFDSKDKVDRSEDMVLKTMYNNRYTIIRDMLHPFISKYERQLLALEASETLMALQSLEPTMFQLKPVECQQLETVEAKYPMVDVNYYQIAAIDCVPKIIVACCLDAVVDCRSNTVVQYLYKTYECPHSSNNYPFFSNGYPWNNDDCLYMAPQYSFSDQLDSDKYINKLLNSYTFGQNKIKRDRLLNRVYNQAMAMSNNAMVRYITKPKPAVEAPPAVLVAPEVVTSVVPASVFASPAMAAPAMMALMMVAPEVAALKMTAMMVPVAPLGNDLPTTQMENNLTVSLIGKDSVVKPNTCVKRHFSLKKIWKKKTKTQRPNDH